MTTSPGRGAAAQAPPGFTRVPVQDGAEAFVEMLNNNGVDYLFLNSGTDTFPVQEAIARLREQERPAPQIIVCPDESTAINGAHGYFQYTRRPQVVLVHVDAGTLNLGGSWHNVQRDRAGMVICAGRAPMTFGQAVPGGRDLIIHWLQEQRDQPGIVRTFSKWDYELRRTESLNWVVQKAFQVASTEPAGPVYLTLPRENLLAPMAYLEVPPASRHGQPVTPAADPEALRTLADWLVRAEKPLIIAGTPGRHPETVPHLAALAEAVGAAVCGALSTRFNLATGHPLNARRESEVAVKEADVILVIDADVAWIPDLETLEPQAKIAWIDIDPIKDTIPLWSFPADLLVQADSRKALPALVEAVKDRLTAADKARIAERSARQAAESAARRERAVAAAQAAGKEKPLHPAWITHCLNQVLPEDAIVLNESVRSSGAIMSVLERSHPQTFFGSGGASLGYALGAAVGMKLADRSREVVTLVGDGTFMFCRPTSAFWAAEKYNAPFLAIIFNDGRHTATKQSWDVHYPDSAGKRLGDYVGVNLDPTPDFDVLVQACRGYGERVEDPDEVLPAIKRGLDRVRDGQAAVLDMRIRRP